MSGAREAIFPTRMALTNTKLRLKGAQTGHSLLAKKRDALMTRFRAILRKVDDVGDIDSSYSSMSADIAISLCRYLSLYNARTVLVGAPGLFPFMYNYSHRLRGRWGV
jgi:ATP synthase subunit D